MEILVYCLVKFIVWKVLSVYIRDNTLIVVNIKDNLMLLFGYKVVECICFWILKWLMSVLDDDFFEFYCVMWKFGRFVIRRLNVLLDLFFYLVILVNSVIVMFYVGVGVWDVDEIVFYIVYVFIVVFIYECDVNFVEFVLKFIKFDREDVRVAVLDILFWYLIMISGNECLNLD